MATTTSECKSGPSPVAGGRGVRPNPPNPPWERPCLVCDGAITGWLGHG